MYHAYGIHEHKRPVWQMSKRPLWRRKGTRSSVLILFAVLIGATIFLASSGSVDDSRRSDSYKASLQSRENSQSQVKESSLQYPLQDSLTPENVEHYQVPARQPLVQSNDIDSASQLQAGYGKDETLLGDADPAKKDKASKLGQVEEDSTSDSKEQDASPKVLENTLVIDESPKPRPAPDSPESDEAATAATDRTKEQLVEDESNESKQHLSLEQRAESFPEFVWVPFEEAVKNEVLQGWEDGWVSSGTFDGEEWGKLKEPKIDFVYLCRTTPF